MIEYRKILLSNGLTIIAHEDHSTPVAAFNIMYDVGARDEHPDHTGFAHLFEHLMFGGSVNIPDFDKPLQERGGVSNAFTNNDITNYYITIPAKNVETAFWLDSDRMVSLAFSDKSLEVQRQVVTEEFRQRYLNQPYGDVWLLLRPLVYKVHPYQWPTIGKKIEHITTATMQQVRDFFFKHYTPSNAILCVAGPFSTDFIFAMAEKWFGGIETRKKYERNIPQEPVQTQARIMEVERDVPSDMVYKVWNMPARNQKEFYSCDLISDVLSRGKSSRLYRELVQGKKVF
ncbi:MAG: M16 family metallopeptidase, partial [Flavobacteriales bacterium]